MTVWVWASDGETEAGLVNQEFAVIAFLRRNLPGARVDRLFPTRLKPAGKPGQVPLAPRSGLTGSALVSELRAYVTGRGRALLQAGDIVVLLDDVDCRFCEPDCGDRGCAERFRWWRDELARAMPEGVELVALLAAPEMEGWFVTTWDRSFHQPLLRKGWTDGAVHAARKRVHARLGRSPETWGRGGPVAGCEEKFSEILVAILAEASPPGVGGTAYSKRLDGPSMLAGLDAETISRSHRRYFAPGWRRLKARSTRR